MISPLTGTYSTKEKSKQNITRDIEVKNNLAITRGEWGGDSEERGLQSYYKGHMEKIKGQGGGRGGMWVCLGCGGEMGRKCRQL